MRFFVFRWISHAFFTLAIGMLSAATFNPTNEADLTSAIQTANFNGDGTNTINFANNIPITSLLFPIGVDETFDTGVKTLNINGNGQTFSGGNSVRGFFAVGGANVVNNLNFSNFNAVGGTGGNGGINGFGGGAGGGFGGGVFIYRASVTLSNCTFSNCSATGGSNTQVVGFGFGGGGGGGLNSFGGDSAISGGGGGGWSGNGGDADFGGGGGGGFTGSGGVGGAFGSSPGGGGAPAYGGGGGGGGGNGAGQGGGGAASFSANGGNGSGMTGGSGGAAVAPFQAGGDGGSAILGGEGGGGGGSGEAVNGDNGQAINGGNGASAASTGFGGGGGGGSAGADVGGAMGGNGGDGNFGGGGGGGGGLGGDGGDGGIFGGGGGGAAIQNGGSGGDGGDADLGGGGGGAGGGGGGSERGGDGGFGGGGGAGIVAGIGGFGGGNGGSLSGTQGGGGAGFGGAIFIHAEGELIVSGSISFGGSSVAGGVGANNGMADGVDIFAMSGSQMIFDISSNVALQNRIASEQGGNILGGLIKRGSARLTLSGDNTYTGTTTVEAGELQINGSVVTNVAVQSGGTLTGNFDVNFDANANGGNLINEGLFSPGVGQLGTIGIADTYTNNASGTLLVHINPAGNQSDKITVGNAMINGGQLQVFVNEGNYINGTEYEVIIGPVAGAFDNQANPTQVGPAAGTIEIEVLVSSLILVIRTNSIFNHQFIEPGVPRQVADCILQQTIVPGSDFAIVVETLGALNDSQLNEALFSLSAVRFGSLEWINARNNSYAFDLLSQHLFELCCSPRNCCSCNCNASVWTSAFGNIMDQKKQVNNLPRYNSDAAGILAGMDFCCGPCVYYGFAFGYTHTDFLWRKNAGRGKIDKYYGALYGSVSWCDCITMDWSVLGGASDNVTKRKLVFGIINRTARGDYWSYFLSGHLGVRFDWCCCNNTFEQFNVIDYHYYTHEKFTESGANSINLRVKSKDQHMLRAEAGARWYYEIDCGCYCYSPYIGLSWVGEFPLHRSKQPASFIDTTCVINATSFKSDFQLGAPQAGIKYTHCNGISLLLGYKGLFNNKIRINEIEGRLEWVF